MPDPVVPVGWSATGLPGAWRRSLTPVEDARGAFLELWRASWSETLDAGAGDPVPRQANLSRSAPGVLRGLHLHRRQADLWIVASGAPFVALVDVRPAVAGTGAPRTVTFDAQPGDAFWIPAGVAHGFLARDPLVLVYLVTQEYDGSDELGFRWDDADAAVPWPAAAPVVSPRDATAPPLTELLARLRADAQGSVAR